MIYANSFEYVNIKAEYDGPYIKRIYLDDGRMFTFDRPENTNCILDNHLLCHFHNVNFSSFSEHLHDFYDLRGKSSSATTTTVMSSSENDVEFRITKNSLLPEKYMSCVRQLLKEGDKQKRRKTVYKITNFSNLFLFVNKYYRDNSISI